MRHKKSGRQFGRDTSSRRAMFRNLAANLITHERIETTDAKAKELRRVAEKLITKATRLGKAAYTSYADLGDADRAKRLHISRQVAAYIPRWGVKTDGTKVDIVEKVLVDLAKRFEGRPGGYTRIIKLGPRRGDGAPISIIEFIDAAAPKDRVEETPEVATAAEPTGAASTIATAAEPVEAATAAEPVEAAKAAEPVEAATAAEPVEAAKAAEPVESKSTESTPDDKG
jgi:large subunit ribosomal protein L17